MKNAGFDRRFLLCVVQAWRWFARWFLARCLVAAGGSSGFCCALREVQRRWVPAFAGTTGQ